MLFLFLAGPPAASQTQSPSPSNAKIVSPQRSPDSHWTKVCRANSPKAIETTVNEEPLCLIFSEVVSDKGTFAVGATLIEVPGKPRKVMRIAVPAGIQLQPGARIFIDQGTPLTSPYTVCSAGICLADFEVDPALFVGLRTGGQLIIQPIDSNGKMMNLVLSLAGFAEAYDAHVPNVEKGTVTKYRRYDNRDLWGGDIGPFLKEIEAENTCASACRNNAQCRAYSFDKWRHACYLKANVADLVLTLDPASVVGIRADIADPKLAITAALIERVPGRRFTGDLYKETSVTAADKCQSACESENACVAFTFRADVGSCQLFTSASAYTADKDSVSGAKMQPPPTEQRPPSIR
jgi:invasion protein IalB